MFFSAASELQVSCRFPCLLAREQKLVDVVSICKVQKVGFKRQAFQIPCAKTSTPSNDNMYKVKWDSTLTPAQKNIWYFLLPSCLWKKQYLTNISLILGEPIFQIYYLMNFKGWLINHVIIFLDSIPDWWNLCLIKKWCMKNKKNAHLRSINPLPKLLDRGRSNIYNHHLYEMKNFAGGREEKDQTTAAPFWIKIFALLALVFWYFVFP